jgi:hypothetical protein
MVSRHHCHQSSDTQVTTNDIGWLTIVHNKTVTRPTVDLHLWRAQKSVGEGESIDIDPQHPQFAEGIDHHRFRSSCHIMALHYVCVGVYHIGIHGYKAPATFTLLVTEGTFIARPRDMDV